MESITVLLERARTGDQPAADRVIELLYAELRQLARSRLRASGGFTLLDTTVLVHESWLRWQGAQEGTDGSGARFPDRHHFLAYAAKVMRSVVVDLVRARQAERRGGQAEHVTLNTEIIDAVPSSGDADVLRVHEALDALAATDARLAQVVEWRYFGGLSEAEIAGILGVTERTVQRDWQKARLLLARLLG